MPSQMSPMGLSHLTPTSQNHPLSPTSQQDQMGALEMTRLALWKLYNQGQPGLPPLMPNLPMDLFANQEKALNLHVAQEQENEKREEEREEQRRRDDQLKERLAALDQTREKERELKERLAELDRDQRDHSSPPPAKRQCVQPPHNKPLPSPSGNRTNISMATREEEDGRTSMEVSMEVNGIMYSGVLFARPS